MTHQFLGEELKKADYDFYLLSLFAPAEKRGALWALFLLNAEIAKTRDMVTDTTLGLIRLQWWRDEIGKIYRNEPCGNIPILSTLAPTIHAQTIPQAWFDELIYAREFDLQGVAPPNFEGLCKYAEFTFAPLNRIALKILGETADEDEIRDISINFGLNKIIRSVPYMLGRGRSLLPEDMLIEKNLSTQKIIDFNYKDDVVDVVQTLVSRIQPIKKTKSSFLNLERGMSSIYLKKIEKIKYNVFSPVMQVPPSFLALRLWVSNIAK